MILFRLVAIAILLSGCATSPVKTARSRPVPSQRLLPEFARVAQSSPQKAKVIVIRDAGILGAGAAAKLLVDGKGIAICRPGERVEFFLSSGDHILGVVPQPQLMGALSETSLSASSGRAYHFRISISETSFKIQSTAESE